MLPVEPQNTLITWPTDGRLRDVHSCLVTGRFFTSPPIFFSHPQKRFWNENGWLWGVYLVTFIQILPPFAFLEYFCILGFGVFFGHFWVFEIFENVFGMRMGDFGRVYLVSFIPILPPSVFLKYFWILGFFGFFGGIFEFLKFSKIFLEWEWVTLGGSI